MLLGKRSIIAIMAGACVILTGYAVNSHCQERMANPQDPAVQSAPIEQQKPLSIRKLRLGLEIIADLDMSPLEYAGPCPGVFTLKGKISVNKPITVQYRFVGRNLPPSLAKPLTFDTPGSKEVSEIRQIGDATTLPTFGGLAILQVVWPTWVESNIVYFKGSCTDEGQPLPTDSSQQTQKEMQPGPQGEQGRGVFPLPKMAPSQGPPPVNMPEPGIVPKMPDPGGFPLPSIGPSMRTVN